MTRRTFYRLVVVLSLLGYAWLGWSCAHPGSGSPCLFHALTGIPCPACGAARALRVLCGQGDVGQSLLINPLGLVLAVMLAVVPLWGAVDAVCRRNTLYRCFLRIDAALRRRAVFLPVALVLAANWIWNILKGL